MFRGSFFRPNLRLHAYRKGQGRPAVRDAVSRLVLARRGESGIVYCLSRRAADALAEHLRGTGVRADAYHAGMDPGARTRVQEAFRRDEIDTICATVAFGMGIDKPNIRYVIHRDMPRSIESYYQEIGRAGRDGLPSECVLFYSYADVMSYDRFADEGASEVAEWHRKRVREMFDLAEAPGCRHAGLVRYFEQHLPGGCVASCDQCAKLDLVADCPATGRRRRGAEVPRARGIEEGGMEDAAPAGDLALLAKLKALRKRLADARGVPAYLVFSDAVLAAMVERRPKDEASLLEISGVGPKKLVRYGAAFLAALQAEGRETSEPRI
jgi:ATP-dependent DNA helicase RecQ